MKQFTAGNNEMKMRISRFVERVTWKLPSSTLYKAFRTGRIKINGKKTTADTLLTAGDVVSLYINDEFFKSKNPSNKPKSGILANQLILFQDQNLGILYKPAGLLSHAGTTVGDSTLLGMYSTYLIQHNEYSPDKEISFAPSLCNRLDRGTEGLVIVAKTRPALRDINLLLRENSINKIYLCICIGRPDNGIFEAYWTKNTATNQVTISAELKDRAKPIATGVRVLEEKKGLSLCEVQLLTGRSHQIRAHLAFLGTPLLGDKKYGSALNTKLVSPASQALCAYKLEFDLDLPAENTCNYLAGRKFTTPKADVFDLWEKL